MGAFIGIVGILGFIGAVVMLVINLFKRKPKRKALIALGVSFALFATGVAISPDPDDDGHMDEMVGKVEAEVPETTEEEPADNEEAAEREVASEDPEELAPEETESETNAVSIVSGGDMEIHFIDVGQGDAILVISPNGNVMLIDGGPRSAGQKVVSYLKAAGVTTIHKMVASHPHEDHIGGLIAVMDNFKVEHVYDSGYAHTTQVFEQYLTKVDQIDADFDVARRGDKISLDPTMAITVIHPASLGNDINDSSVALKIQYGEVSFITTGDAESHAERAMVNSGINLEAQILKAGHHGSSTSSTSALLDAVQPEMAVIMVGESNRYGHPTDQILNNLSRRGIDVYRTDKQGNIVVTTDGASYRVNRAPDPVMVAVNETPAPAPTPTPDPTPTPETSPASVAESFIGNVNSKIFHKPSCSSLPIETNRVYFSNRQEAIDAGHRGCKRCNP